ncbi:MAG: hypothetical protein KGD68_00625 [Candidatus Lokiarchaeota archaeon]|nr:hypothetical protein [Candidatus Lokiarchaeota archaeon]
MLIVTQHWWPHGASSKVGKIYLEAMKKYPDDKTISKPILRSAIWAVKDGSFSITVSSIQSGKVKESMDLAMKRLLMLAESIDGFKYEIHIAYDLVEGMPLIGLAAPE